MRDQELIRKRYGEWARLPIMSEADIAERRHAWHLYCDARDGLPDGSSAAKEASIPYPDSTRQLSLFDRRLA